MMTDMNHANLGALTALSPLDGRYAAKVEPLRAHFSEFGLIRNRIRVEIEWLKALAANPEIAEVPAFSSDTIAELDLVISGFSVVRCRRGEADRGRHQPRRQGGRVLAQGALQEQRRGDARHRVHPLRLHLGRHQQHLARADAQRRARADSAAGAGLASSNASARWPTIWPSCRCWRAPTASRPRRPRWARRWPTSPRG